VAAIRKLQAVLSRELKVSRFSNVADALARTSRGGLLVIVGADGKEASLFLAAKWATPEKLAFAIRNSSGIVCAPMDGVTASRLQLNQMVPESDARPGVSYTVSIDSKIGVTTGISAGERAKTLNDLARPDARDFDFARPGHVFPLVSHPEGTIGRPGRTEAAVDLCVLAGLAPVGVTGALYNDDGTALRGDRLASFVSENGLVLVSAAEIADYRYTREKLLTRTGEATIAVGTEGLRAISYQSSFEVIEHSAFILGDISQGERVPVVFHKSDLLNDVFGKDTFATAIQNFRGNHCGVFLLARSNRITRTACESRRRYWVS
jgi:3,4-dihydroxy 2-butanone 4-phosphate synthase / GTP cyclohydrolase II